MNKMILIFALAFSLDAREAIHVMFETDAHFVHPTCVAITSLLSNANPLDRINIHIVTSNVSNEDKAKFESLRKIRKFNLEIKDFDEKILESLTVYPGYTNVVYNRLFAAELFPAINKIIHIDSDMIIKQSLYQLWKIDLKNNWIAAVPRFAWMKLDTALLIEGGISMMDLEKFRANNLTKKLFDAMIAGQERVRGKKDMFGRELRYTDEHAITEVCKDRVHLLPLRYNIWQTEVPKIQPTGLLSQTDFTMKYEQTHPVILHYNSPNKPWKLTREEYSKRYPVYLYDEWKHYEDIYASSVL